MKPSILVFSFVQIRRVGTAERVEKEHAVAIQRVVDAREVGAHLVARLEAEVAEVERADDIDAARCSTVRTSSLQELDPRTRRLRQPRDTIPAPPVEHVGVEIDADGVPRADPCAPTRRRDSPCRRSPRAGSTASRPRNARNVSRRNSDLDVDRLHGPFVEIMDVGLFGHRDRKLLLRRGYHVVYLEPNDGQGGRSL